MNKKQFNISVGLIGAVLVIILVTNAIYSYIDNWLWIFIGATLAYMYLRYRMSAPIQLFANKFNMLVDYDLDIETANQLADDGVKNAPTAGIKAIYMVYSGMAKYYKGDYRESINVFNQIDLKKLNPAYHVLVYAFIAYSAYEEGDTETYDIALEKIKSAQNRVGRKYMGFAAGYIQILEAIKNLDEDPENYREIIERHFAREDGYITTKLIYNYRMALYYKSLNNIEEMDKCLAKVIANGKEHHTAIQSKKLFQNTCNIEDFVFVEEEENEIEDIEVVEDDLMLEETTSFDEEVDAEDIESKTENKEE